MQVVDERVPEVVRVPMRRFHDERGFFQELHRNAWINDLPGDQRPFVQTNMSRSAARVVRGIHYQLESGQGKLVHCLQGRIRDYAVDLRKGSEAFGTVIEADLEPGGDALWIPPGFGHAFQATEDATVLYHCTSYYDPAAERGIHWADPDLAIKWPLTGAIVSDKDEALPLLADADLP